MYILRLALMLSALASAAPSTHSGQASGGDFSIRTSKSAYQLGANCTTCSVTDPNPPSVFF